MAGELTFEPESIDFDNVEAVPTINTETFDLINQDSWTSQNCLRKI